MYFLNNFLNFLFLKESWKISQVPKNIKQHIFPNIDYKLAC